MSWGLQIDSLSLVMMAVVTLVSFMVHIYSVGYMKGDPGIPRFMALLKSIYLLYADLVTAPNLLPNVFWMGGCGAMFVSFDWVLV